MSKTFYIASAKDGVGILPFPIVSIGLELPGDPAGIKTVVISYTNGQKEAYALSDIEIREDKVYLFINNIKEEGVRDGEKETADVAKSVSK